MTSIPAQAPMRPPENIILRNSDARADSANPSSNGSTSSGMGSRDSNSHSSDHVGGHAEGGDPSYVSPQFQAVIDQGASIRAQALNGAGPSPHSGAESGDANGTELTARKGQGSRASGTYTVKPEGGSWGEVITDATINGASAAGAAVISGVKDPRVIAGTFALPFVTTVATSVDIEQTRVPPSPDMSGGRDSPRPVGGESESPRPTSQAASGSGMGPDGAVPPPSQAASGSGMGPDGATGGDSGGGTASRGNSGSDGSQSTGPGSESGPSGTSDSSDSGDGETSEAASGSGMGPDGATTP